MENNGITELNYCYNCMRQLGAGQTICPDCGYDNRVNHNPPEALPEGSMLAGQYLVGKLLGQGGFGITYLGFDLTLQKRVAVKEYYPRGVCMRVSGSNHVTGVSTLSHPEDYGRGLEEFRREAQILAQISSPNIVRVLTSFRENGTAYIVMEYAEGTGLSEEVMNRGGRLPWQRVTELFKDLIRELGKLHERHLIHRDIKPDNLRITKDETGVEKLILLDFGTARHFESEEVSQTYTAMLTPGYAPAEQYLQKGRQGPYTDIYALCAAMYAAITGKVPPPSLDRTLEKIELKTIKEQGVNVPERVDKAIMHGLEVRREDRPQSMGELYDELYGAGGADLVPPVKPKLWIILLVIAALSFGVFFLVRNTQNERTAVRQTQTAFSLSEIRAAETQTKEAESTEPALPVIQTDPPTDIPTVVPSATSTPRPAKTSEPTATSTTKPTETPVPTEAPKPAVKPGDIITLGQYEQDGNTANGEEAIEWRVLTVEPEKILLISEYCLDAQPFESGNYIDSNWEYSSLRTWAKRFFDTSFEPDVQNRILWTRLQNPEYVGSYKTIGGGAVEDKVFLLSKSEAESYMPDPSLRQCKATAYAASQGARTSNGMALWWLRPEKFIPVGLEVAEDKSLVAYDGKIHNSSGINDGDSFWEDNSISIKSDFVAVRLSFWLDISAVTGPAVTEIITEPAVVPTKTPEPAAAPKPAVKTGDIITLGKYEQDGNTVNGAEAIEWQVLAVEDGRALVISRYSLDAKPYNEELTDVTWETCTLRAWLNGEFFNSAFGSDEKGRIRQVTLKNPDNGGTKGGKDTTDRIFLLSIDEAEQYFAGGEARKSRPTAYAVSRGAGDKDSDTVWWWLRTPGSNLKNAAGVNSGGEVRDRGGNVNYSSGTARPVFWLDLTGGADTTVVTGTEPVRTNTPGTTGVQKPGQETGAVKKGDIIRLGQYEQDGDLTNGTEAIEWQVLVVEDGRALVISKYALDAKPYNEKLTDVTWETCTLRVWLNGEFYNSAFSDEEKGRIRQITLKNPDNDKYGTKGGNDTTDRMFLLSINEANQYFANDEAQKCRLTTYAKNKGAYVYEETGTAWWWLRSPGWDDSNAAFVSAGGGVYTYGYFVDTTDGAVRPAFWMNL